MRAVLFLIVINLFFVVITGTMFNVAVPVVASDFQLSPSQTGWMLTIFTAFFGLGTLIYGKLADVYPVKRLVIAGLVLFGIGGAIGYLSQWYWLLLVSRFVQAVGAAAMPSLAMAMAMKYAPAENRGSVLGIIAAVVSFSLGIGPLTGGYLIALSSWRMLFLVPMCTLVTVPLIMKFFPNDVPQAGRNSDAAKHLFHKPELLANRPYRYALIMAFFVTGTIFGTLFIIPLMLWEVNGLQSFQIGVVIFPGAFIGAVLGVYGGRLADRKGSSFIVFTGLVTMLAGFLLLSAFAGASHWVIMFILVISYVGFSFIQAALPKAISAVLEERETGLGIGLYNLTFFFSGAFHYTVAGKLLDGEAAEAGINPFLADGAGILYSNVFLGYVGIVLIGIVMFYFAYYRSATVTRKFSQGVIP